MGAADPNLVTFANPGRGDGFKHHLQAKDNDFFLAPSQTIRTNDDSGVYSPPLWQTTASSRRRIRDLSPSSRIQAVNRGQKELMDMVRNMPEASYELSLTDLVELHHHDPVEQGINDTMYRNGRCDSKKPQMKRSGSLDNGGFLLKMVCPIGIAGSNKKEMDTTNSNCNTCSKVSPKPLRTTSSSVGYRKGVEKDRWKWKSDASRDSQSSSNFSSSNCSKNNSRQLGGSIPGCWAFFSCITCCRRSKHSRAK